jgi:hypothetical protein
MGMSHSVEQSSPAAEPMEVENPEEPVEEPEEEQVHESFDWFLSWI